MKSLTNHFLIAMPKINDSLFSGSLVYLCGHNDDGAVGVIINKPSSVRMNQLFEAIDIETPKRFSERWVLLGGPMQIDRGFFVHTPVGKWQSSIIVNDDIAITSSRDIITGLSEDVDETIKTFATIGYSNWIAGQLEKEIESDQWLVVPSDMKILFDLPIFRRYDAALQKLGISAAHLSAETGHA
ncbi:MAG: YqgE/AlgH family protein [Neisseriaceae bacterium]|nr:YqgE/AlgH family protein [Neisseriaceae bacterium]